jgi:Transposase domain (DUF772)
MPLYPVPFPPIPEDTARAVEILFGKGNVYIRLGEHINEILSQLGAEMSEVPGKSSAETNLWYAMIVAFQFAEELTDRQILEALRNRVDLKYALHLPMNYPGLDPKVLCQYRKQVFTDPASRQVFQILLDSFTEFGLLKSNREQPLVASQVIDEVCASNRLEIVMEAMHRALESLTATNAEWLRLAARPHWYVRYSRQTTMRLWPNNKEKWEAVALTIGADIQYLLEEIDKSQLPVLTSLREVQLLRQVLEEQFDEYLNGESDTLKMRWRLTRCVSCTKD